METVFSYVLTVNGFNIENFGEMKVIQNVDGYGMSGVCTSEFTVTILKSEYDMYKISSCAPVEIKLGESSFSPIFYIATRTLKNNKVTFKCYDRMMYIDQTFDVTNLPYSNNENYSKSAVISAIVKQCGFNEWRYAGETSLFEFNISIDYLKGKSCRTLLEEISKVLCGFFKIGNDNSLLFVLFGSAYYLGSKVPVHTEISTGGQKGPVKQIIVINGDDVYYAGDKSSDVLETIKITTTFASQSLADNIYERLNGYVYEAWNCERCILDNIWGEIENAAEITFADGSTRVANNIIKIPTSSGIYLSCGNNDVVENEFDYTGALSRKIDSKIGDGETLGNNTMITRYQGVVHLGEKFTDDDGNVTQNRYGYKAATSSGIVEFEGAMVSRVTPTGATISSDGKEAVVQYDGKSYKYNLEYDSSGNVTSFAKEEVVE